jgi:UDP-glucose 4-epimerase
VPDETVMPAPGTPYGASLLQVEAIASGVRARHGIGVCALRYAPVVGSHVPSPLGRLLRLPLVPVAAFADPPFQMLHPDDAATAMVAAIERRYDGPLNIVGAGAATPWQATRLGGRIPVPVLPPFWTAAARTAELAGAAIAPHVVELLRHGRTGAAGRAIAALGLTNLRTTQHVLTELFEWANVVSIDTARAA